MASRLTYYTYPMPHGPITIGATVDGICRISFEACEFNGTNEPSAHTNTAATQLQEYFAGKRKDFDVPFDIRGSEFSLAVWDAVAKIPYGTFMTVTDFAEFLGKPGAHRSIGSVLKRNPIPILIPTHRVLSGNGVSAQSKTDAGLRALEAQFA